MMIIKCDGKRQNFLKNASKPKSMNKTAFTFNCKTNSVHLKKEFSKADRQKKISSFSGFVFLKDFNTFKNSSQEWKCTCFLIHFQF